MGGVLSGPRGWRGGKPSTASLPVARLTSSQNFTLAHRRTYVRIDAPDSATVVHGMREWGVRIDFTPLHFGGGRRWLVCPVCHARREALYVSGKVLACRACLGLRYDSQHENRRQRALRAADRVREALGWRPGILSPDGDKPKGMHWGTYWRLIAELSAMTDALFWNLDDWADRASVRRRNSVQ